MLQELDYLPGELLHAESRQLDSLLGAPTLIHLAGDRDPPLFVSVLMHGNETVGWDAVRLLLARRIERFRTPRLPRSLSVLIGNVSAAAAGVRHLPGQPDYNRVWPGSELARTREHALMEDVMTIMAERGCFASIDLHNNTGVNPHYACVNRIDNRFLHLATLFSRTVVYFLRPRGVQSMAMAELCPSITLECGKTGERAGADHALELVDAALHLREIPDHPVTRRDIDLFHTVARVRVGEDASFAFAPEPADLMLDPELEHFNFRELPPGTSFGQVRSRGALPLEVRDEQGEDVSGRYFGLEDDELRLLQPVMPSMLTRNQVVIRQDCLGYLMERYDHAIPRRDGLD